MQKFNDLKAKTQEHDSPTNIRLVQSSDKGELSGCAMYLSIIIMFFTRNWELNLCWPIKTLNLHWQSLDYMKQTFTSMSLVGSFGAWGHGWFDSCWSGWFATKHESSSWTAKQGATRIKWHLGNMKWSSLFLYEASGESRERLWSNENMKIVVIVLILNPKSCQKVQAGSSSWRSTVLINRPFGVWKGGGLFVFSWGQLLGRSVAAPGGWCTRIANLTTSGTGSSWGENWTTFLVSKCIKKWMPFRELTNPTLGKGTSFSNINFWTPCFSCFGPSRSWVIG